MLVGSKLRRTGATHPNAGGRGSENPVKSSAKIGDDVEIQRRSLSLSPPAKAARDGHHARARPVHRQDEDK